MSELFEVSAPSPRQCAAIVFLLLMLIAVPAAITLTTVRVPGTLVIDSPDPTPHGYTVSLLLYIVPSLAIAFWLLPRERLKVPRKAFWITMGLLFPIGAGLDIVFAHWFFTYDNAGATLGIKVPVWHGWVPIEEFVFYFTGFLAVLLVYIWVDEYWLRKYQIVRTGSGKLFQFHWPSLVTGLLLIAAGVAYKRFAGIAGFPSYFTFLVALALTPSSFLLPTARPLINWRAFTLTMLFSVMVSLLWEATLGVPYGWWGYQSHAMLGIFIGAWSNLPVEEVIVWLAMTYVVVIVFHTVKQWLVFRGEAMSEASAVDPLGPAKCAAFVFLLVLLIAVPMAITLTTVKVPGKLIIASGDPTPYGYTVSLLLWITPILAMSLWLIPREHLKPPRQAFFLTMAIMFPLGWALDFFFAHLFFGYPNKGATMGLTMPVMHGVVPIEECIYYFIAPLATLSMYVWLDEYWMRAYHVRSEILGKLVKLHWGSLILGLLLIIAGIAIKKASGTPGFPGYFTFVVVVGFVPVSLFMPVARSNINWRAFSATLFFTVLVSALWEGSLAVRYGWWVYRPDQMLGFFIKAWSGLPAEEPLVWISLTVSVVTSFETIKVWLRRRADRTRTVQSGIATVSGR
jgi:lycopene cyclase-like protein